jgi:porin
VDPQGGKGLDGTFAYDWSPASINRNSTLLTVGLRYNEPLPVHFHNAMSLGYVHNSLSSQFLPVGAPPWRTEQGLEFNALGTFLPMLLLQPVVQCFANAGAGSQHDVVFGFRTKIEF